MVLMLCLHAVVQWADALQEGLALVPSHPAEQVLYKPSLC